MSAPALLVFLPNLITLARLLCVPVVVWLIMSGHWETAFWVFFAASITDLTLTSKVSPNAASNRSAGMSARWV